MIYEVSIPNRDQKGPQLSETDLETVRQLYTEAQNWARHYELMVVNTNVLLISASSIYIGNALGDKPDRAAMVLGIPMVMSLIGFVLTSTLSTRETFWYDWQKNFQTFSVRLLSLREALRKRSFQLTSGSFWLGSHLLDCCVGGDRSVFSAPIGCGRISPRGGRVTTHAPAADGGAP
jgi:hypothetical protein